MTRCATAKTCIGLAAIVSGCMLNRSGHLAAPRLGDTSHPLERGSPIAELRQACGDGVRTAAGGIIHRQPYLQRVTTSSAMLGWITSTGVGERVVVTAPGGAAIATIGAEVADAAKRPTGEHQMWARIEGLQPDTIYCYAIVAESALTVPTGFRTAPAADTSKTVRVLAFGDSGGGAGDQHALRDQMYKVPFDLVVHTGDLAPDTGTIGEFDHNVFGVYAELVRNVPLFPSAGNHDYKMARRAPFNGVFAHGGDPGVNWYSYDWGRIHFAALDTEADYAVQASWLDADLSAHQRPWTIVYLHRSPYSSGAHGSDLPLRRALAPVLERHHVQLVLSGHDHDYERVRPQNGVVYVVTGGGGQGTRPVGTSSFTAFSAEVIHFVVVDVGIDQLILHAIDATGVEFDSVVVPRV